MLAIFDPTAFPKLRLGWPLKAAVTDTINSGAEAANPITTNPIISVGILAINWMVAGSMFFACALFGGFLKEQVEAISEISKHISVLERFNGDQHAMWNYVESNF
mgnify:CR=1 FL=1